MTFACVICWFPLQRPGSQDLAAKAIGRLGIVFRSPTIFFYIRKSNRALVGIALVALIGSGVAVTLPARKPSGPVTMW